MMVRKVHYTDTQIPLFNYLDIYASIFPLPYRQTEGVVVRAHAGKEIPSISD
jgi:hypothetical protein